MQSRAVKITHAFAGIAVTDFPTAYEWYVHLFGRAADMFPHDREAVWRFTSTASVYVVGDPGRAGNGLVTLAVADLEACEDRLRANGVPLTEQAGGNAPRRLTATDEDGNTITFFEDSGGPA
jgi:catechol 2,3-dioxygenase-like lactoylglutathione lyase family enzyme